MAGTVTTFNSDNRAVERDPICLVFEYQAEAGASKSEEIVLRAIPEGTTYLRAQIQTIVADTGATSTVLNLKHGSTTIFTGSADNGGTVDTIDDGVSSGTFDPTAADDVSADNLIADFDQVGTTSFAPKFRIIIECLRTSF